MQPTRDLASLRVAADRAPDILVDDSLGRSQHLTPEGFLLCSGVRIARTGPLLYTAEEVPEVEPTPHKTVLLERDGDILFHPDTLASFQGKPVTNDHPDELVTPENAQGLACGVVLNPRRGEGLEAEYLVADLLLTDAQTISAVRSGKREVSCGYERDCEPLRPGHGRISRIVGNHVALVERGRCGPSCAIQDKEPAMALKAKRTVWDRLTTAFKARDEAAFTEELESAQAEASKEDGPEIHVHLPPGLGQQAAVTVEPETPKGEPDPIEARFAKLEGMVESIAAAVAKIQGAERAEADATMQDDDDEEEEAEERKPPVAVDSAGLLAEFRDTLSRAEILAPGIRLPAFDAKATRKVTVDALCGLRRKALTRAMGDEATRKHVEAVAGGGVAFDGMPCAQVGVVFRAASELAKSANSKPAHDRDVPKASGPMTAARYAEMIRQRRARA